MVMIEKNRKTVYVPKEYFEKVYKPRGWRLANSKDSPPENSVPIKRDTESLVDELDSLNTLEQLREFAERNGVNVESMTNRKQVRSAILNAMNM